MTMARPTTIRLSDDLLRDLDARARARGKDRATFLRDVLRQALDRAAEDEVLAEYSKGRLSLTGTARRLGVDPWELLDRLRARDLKLSVSLEDWIDSRSGV
jgi:predicted transcriptional regulator